MQIHRPQHFFLEIPVKQRGRHLTTNFLLSLGEDTELKGETFQ